MTSAAPGAPAQQGRRAVTIGTVSWLVILAAVALVQLARRAYIDSAVLLVALTVLLVDATRRGSRPAVESPVSRAAVAGHPADEPPTSAFTIAERPAGEPPTSPSATAERLTVGLATSPGAVTQHPAVQPPTSRWAVAAPAILAGAVLVIAPRHGPVAGAAVAAAGVGAIAYAWPDRADSPTWDRSTTRTAFAWAAAWVAGCLWELAMFLLGGTRPDGRETFPAASDLLDPLLANPIVKAAFVVVWLAVGVRLLARADRR